MRIHAVLSAPLVLCLPRQGRETSHVLYFPVSMSVCHKIVSILELENHLRFFFIKFHSFVKHDETICHACIFIELFPLEH